jgi:Fic family protein
MFTPADLPPNGSGALLRVDKGAWAFVPGALPPKVVLTASISCKTEEAARELGHLGGVGRTLLNPHLLIRPFVSREAVQSSKIEGSQATVADLLLLEAAPKRASEDTREVARYVAALDHALERIKKRPVSLNLLREIHEILMAHLPSAGQFRRRQNWIGPPGSDITEATYVPPPVSQMTEALDALEKFIHAPGELPFLIKLAAIHYQFEAIHPFIDGNGRVGRLLLALLLCTDEILPHPLLYLSEFFEKHRRRYYELLLAVSRDGAWNDWFDFFLTGVAVQARDASARAIGLQNLRRKLQEKFQNARSSALLLKLIDHLFETPFISIPGAQRVLRLTPRGAALNVAKLVNAGILKKVSGSSHPALFVAPEILEAFSSPAES